MICFSFVADEEKKSSQFSFISTICVLIRFDMFVVEKCTFSPAPITVEPNTKKKSNTRNEQLKTSLHLLSRPTIIPIKSTDATENFCRLN